MLSYLFFFPSSSFCLSRRTPFCWKIRQPTTQMSAPAHCSGATRFPNTKIDTAIPNTVFTCHIRFQSISVLYSGRHRQDEQDSFLQKIQIQLQKQASNTNSKQLWQCPVGRSNTTRSASGEPLPMHHLPLPIMLASSILIFTLVLVTVELALVGVKTKNPICRWLLHSSYS